MVRTWNAVLVKNGYRFSERDHALVNELSVAFSPSRRRAIVVFEV